MSLVIFVDFVFVCLAVTVMVFGCRLGHSHPMVVYVVFHVLFFSLRFVAVAGGAPTLFSDWGPGYDPITLEEIARAAWLADLGLLAMAVGCTLATARSMAGRGILPGEPALQTISSTHVLRICMLAFPVGLLSFLYLTKNPFVGTASEIAEEGFGGSYVAITQTWAGLCLIALIYLYGFRVYLALPMLVYLAVMMFQGYHRFRVIIPVLLLVQISLDRANRRWPSVSAVCLVAALILISIPLKGIGRMVQRGESIETVLDFASGEISKLVESQDTNQEFFDQFASTVSLADEAKFLAYGSTYLPLLTLPIPRALWPEKPGLSDHLLAISTGRRPMGKTGMVTTLLGESYVNFGVLGVILVPAGLGFLLTQSYQRAYDQGFFTIYRFSYLLISCNFIQVYRDGLTALIMFTLVNMMPLCAIVGLHWLWPYSAPGEIRAPQRSGAAGWAGVMGQGVEPRSANPGRSPVIEDRPGRIPDPDAAGRQFRPEAVRRRSPPPRRDADRD